MDGVAIPQNDILVGMVKLFKLWFTNGMLPKIDPFDQCVRTIVLKKLCLRRPKQDRAQLGVEVLVIDRDGTLSCDAFREHGRIGNIVHTSMKEIVRSIEYLRLIEEENQLKKTVCGGCSFMGACDTSPIARNFDSHVLGDCPTEKYLLPMIQSYLEEIGFFDDDFEQLSHNMTKSYLEGIGMGMP
jgi:uncharacterized protein